MDRPVTKRNAPARHVENDGATGLVRIVDEFVEGHLGARTERELGLVLEHDLGKAFVADRNDLVLNDAVVFGERARFLVDFRRHLIDDLDRRADRVAVLGKAGAETMAREAPSARAAIRMGHHSTTKQ